MADFAKLMKKAAKNYSFQQEKLQKNTNNAAEIRHSSNSLNATRNESTHFVKRDSSSGSLAASISAIRNKHLSDVAEKKSKKENEVKLKQKEMERKSKLREKVESERRMQKPGPKNSSTGSAMDFSKLMQMAEKNKINPHRSLDSLDSLVRSSKQSNDKSLSAKGAAHVSLSSARISSTESKAKKAPTFDDLMQRATQNIGSSSEKSKQQSQPQLLKNKTPRLISSRSVVGSKSIPKNTNPKKTNGKTSSGFVQKGNNNNVTQSRQRSLSRNKQVNKSSSSNGKVASSKELLPHLALRKPQPPPGSSKQRPPSLDGKKLPDKTSLLPHVAPKRPLPSQTSSSTNRKAVKSQRVCDNAPLLPFLEKIPGKRTSVPVDDYEDESDDSFIVSDDEIDGEKVDRAAYLRELREITGYDPSKFGDHDIDCRNMETSFRDLVREEAISAKIGLREDLEDMRLEEAKLARKKKKK